MAALWAPRGSKSGRLATMQLMLVAWAALMGTSRGQASSDKATLLQVKAELMPPDYAASLLANWRTDTDPCNSTWTGVACRSIAGRRAVTSLNLANTYFTGTVPTAISRLTNLTTLLMSDTFMTTLPPQFSALTNLDTLNFQNTPLGNSLPDAYSALVKMTSLIAIQSNLTGSLPTSWSTMASIHLLELSGNRLGGSVPSDWSAMQGVALPGGALDLATNFLTGTVPEDWCSLKGGTVFLTYNWLSNASLPACFSQNFTIFTEPRRPLSPSPLPKRGVCWLLSLQPTSIADLDNSPVDSSCEQPDGSIGACNISLVLNYTKVAAWSPNVGSWSPVNVSRDVYRVVVNFNASVTLGAVEVVYTKPGYGPTGLRLYSGSSNKSLLESTFSDNPATWTATATLQSPFVTGALYVEMLKTTDNPLAIIQLRFRCPLASEQDVLLQIKAELVPADAVNQHIASWTKDGDHCSGAWAGVTCSVVDGGKKAVTQLLLAINYYSGTIPVTISLLTGLTDLRMGVTSMHTLPTEFSTLTNLEIFYTDKSPLGNRLPDTYSTLTNLQLFWANNAGLTGTLPSSWSNLASMQALRLDQNALTGTLPASWRALYGVSQGGYIDVEINLLSGSLPTEWCGLGSGEAYLAFNRFNISTPSCAFWNQSDLSPQRAHRYSSKATLLQVKAELMPPDYADTLFPNWRDDTDPCNGSWAGVGCQSIGGKRFVTSLNISNTYLTGTVPTSISQLTGLTNLRFDNTFMHTLPEQFSTLTNLNSFYADQTPLGNSLPDAYSTLTKLTLFHAVHCNLSGTLPTRWSGLTSMNSLALDQNGLGGSLPIGWSAMQGVAQAGMLGLAGNFLTGTVPADWCSLKGGTLFLAYNRLSNASLPACLSQMTYFVEPRRPLTKSPLPQRGACWLLSLQPTSTEDLDHNPVDDSCERHDGTLGACDVSLVLNYTKVAAWSPNVGAWRPVDVRGVYRVAVGFDANVTLGAVEIVYRGQGDGPTGVRLYSSSSNKNLLESTFSDNPATWTAAATLQSAVVTDTLYMEMLKTTDNPIAIIQLRFRCPLASEQDVLLQIKSELVPTDVANYDFRSWTEDGDHCSGAWAGVTCSVVNGKKAVTQLLLAQNSFTGTIPVTVSLLTDLTDLRVALSFMHTLPAEFSTLTNLEVFHAENAPLDNSLPDTYSTLTKLTLFSAFQSGLTGTLPNSWSTLTSLNMLRLDQNSLSGTLPANWSALSRLSRGYIVLEVNSLTGALPPEWCALQTADSYMALNQLDSKPTPSCTFWNHSDLTPQRPHQSAQLRLPPPTPLSYPAPSPPPLSSPMTPSSPPTAPTLPTPSTTPTSTTTTAPPALGSSSDSPSNGGVATGTIVGAVVGGVVAALLIAAIVAWTIRRRRAATAAKVVREDQRSGRGDPLLKSAGSSAVLIAVAGSSGLPITADGSPTTSASRLQLTGTTGDKPDNNNNFGDNVESDSFNLADVFSKLAGEVNFDALSPRAAARSAQLAQASFHDVPGSGSAGSLTSPFANYCASPTARAALCLVDALHKEAGQPLQPLQPPRLIDDLQIRDSLRMDLDSEHDVVIHQDQLLGDGAIGLVVRGSFEGRPVAVKLLKSEVVNSMHEDADSFRHELMILARLNHPNIVLLHGGSLKATQVFLVMELMSQSLADYIESCRSSGLCMDQVFKIAKDILSGLAYLHSVNVVHRDIKPLNVLLDGHGNAKISDFGLARGKYKTYLSTKKIEVGTVAYMPPECFDDKFGGITVKADVYSFGIMLWELLTLSRPWENMDHIRIITQVAIMEQRPTFPEGREFSYCPPALRSLVQACWASYPRDRPSSAKALEMLVAAERAHLLEQQISNQVGGQEDFWHQQSTFNVAAAAAAFAGLELLDMPTDDDDVVEDSVEEEQDEGPKEEMEESTAVEQGQGGTPPAVQMYTQPAVQTPTQPRSQAALDGGDDEAGATGK